MPLHSSRWIQCRPFTCFFLTAASCHSPASCQWVLSVCHPCQAASRRPCAEPCQARELGRLASRLVSRLAVRLVSQLLSRPASRLASGRRRPETVNRRGRHRRRHANLYCPMPHRPTASPRRPAARRSVSTTTQGDRFEMPRIAACCAAFRP